MTRTHLATFDIIRKQLLTVLSPFQMCPPPLFAEIIKINHLRARAAAEAPPEPSQPHKLSGEGYQLLAGINLFSPNHWAQSKPSSSKKDWVLIASIYHAAVVVYCISSLRSLAVFPRAGNALLDSQRATHAPGLRDLLVRGLAVQSVRRFTLWPLVVLGVEATSSDMQAFVAEHLEALSQDVGTYVPLAAKGALGRFWERGGEGGWDGCFGERAYAFTTQIAVDISRVEYEGR